MLFQAAWTAIAGQMLPVLTAYTNGTVRLWKIKDRIRLATFEGHTTEVNSAVFGRDQRQVLTASFDGTVRQFLVEADDLLAVAARRVARSLTDMEISQFNVPRPLRFDPAAEDVSSAALT